jgi:hypothetical protein
VSDAKTVSSTNPACFLRIGSTLSLMVFESSRAFPDLLVSSTTLVYVGTLLSVADVKGTSRGLRDLACFVEWEQPTPVVSRGQLHRSSCALGPILLGRCGVVGIGVQSNFPSIFFRRLRL